MRISRWSVVALLAAAHFAVPRCAEENRAPFDPGRASFRLQVGQETTSYRIMTFSVLPGKDLAFQVVSPMGESDYEASADTGALREEPTGRWTWTAPADGHHTIRIRRKDTGDTMQILVFVLVPLANVAQGTIEGYRIGAYPSTRYRDLAAYDPPRGLIRVTPSMLDLEVAPHFRLRQFLCKQESGYPKFLALRTRLLLKLEFLLEAVNGAGHRCDTFGVLSGYRTPYYNHSIGNVKYSRHMWGGAADIFIDESPRDGLMDDLNGDGLIDRKDAAILYKLTDRLYERSEYKRFRGGLGQYGKSAAHGPFVHVDVRGFRARWGTVDQAREPHLGTSGCRRQEGNLQAAVEEYLADLLQIRGAEVFHQHAIGLVDDVPQNAALAVATWQGERAPRRLHRTFDGGEDVHQRDLVRCLGQREPSLGATDRAQQAHLHQPLHDLREVGIGDLEAGCDGLAGPGLVGLEGQETHGMHGHGRSVRDSQGTLHGMGSFRVSQMITYI